MSELKMETLQKRKKMFACLEARAALWF